MISEITVSIGIDDFHPESSKNGYDCGGDMKAGSFAFVDELLAVEPDAKATLYVTPDWAYKPYGRWERGLFDLRAHPAWTEWLKGCCSDGRLELAEHGLFHWRCEWPFGEEFRDTSKDESLRLLRKAREIFSETGLPVSRGFRPPCWAIGKGLVEALGEYDFEFVAASSDVVSDVRPGTTSCQWGLRSVSLLHPEPIGDTAVVNIPANWDPYWSDVERAFHIVEAGGVVAVTSHIQAAYWGETIENGLSRGILDKMIHLFGALRDRYHSSITFLTHSELCRRARAACSLPPAAARPNA